jgi:hypothetical protein
MTAWSKVYDELLAAIDDFGFGTIFFRGHTDAGWKLLPGLARMRSTNVAEYSFGDEHSRERSVYAHFARRAGNLVADPQDSWAILFSMQHHGLPTRLLDWTTTLSIAIYFAVNTSRPASVVDSAVWMLDPFELNQLCCKKDTVGQPSELPGTYQELFLETEPSSEPAALALFPQTYNPRIFSQQAGFTLHRDLMRSLDEIAPAVLRKVIIPREAFEGAKRFLRVAGISEFALFPDLDGLARELKSFYF